MLGSAGRVGSLEMSCGVSTWWRGRGARVSWQMSPGRKGEWGWWSEKSPSSPVPVAPAPDLPLSHPWRPPAQPQAHSRGPFLCSEQGRGGPRLALVLSCPQRCGWPTQLLGDSRVYGERRLWAAGHFSTGHLQHPRSLQGLGLGL